jgi:hypothetical protein
MNKIIENEDAQENLRDKFSGARRDNNSQGSNNTLTSNSDNINENNKRVKRTRNKLTKKDQFINERDEIIKKIYEILKIDGNNKTFLLYDIENSEEIKTKLSEMDEKIKKFFKVGNWNYYIQKNNGIQSPIIGLIRALLKDCDIDLTKKDISMMVNGKKIRTTKYFLNSG